MLKHKIFALSLGFGGLIFATQHAYGQQTNQCGPREGVLAVLAEQYGESRRGIGIAGNNAVMELFASGETGTWTVTVTLTNGMTCLLASGQNFESLTDAIPAPGQGA
jgi:hypothetical protein